jgi:CubicO group peptidase (beta-lactamase class C family)
MLHTAGFGYDFFNEDLVKYGEKRDVPSIVTGEMASLKSPLLFDPGERWEYGSNIDWVGKVVEGARGKRLGDVFAERIFGPLGMNDTAIMMSEDMRSRPASLAGPASPTSTTGSTARTAWEASGRPRCFRSPSRSHSVDTWTSRRRSTKASPR